MLNKLLKLDWILLISVFLLLGIGLISLYSLSLASHENKGLSIFGKQCLFLALGLTVMIFLAFSDYHYLRSYSTPIYFGSLVLLVAVLFWGSTIRGTVGWLGVGPFHIQPVEVTKLALIIFLASFISQKKMELSETGRVIASLVLTGITVFLTLKQPDLGSAVILVVLWLAMMLISGISRKFFLILAIGGVLLSLIAWAALADYQKTRVLSFIAPELDPRGSGYNVIQARVAVGSGGILGKGIGHGSQSQLNFLPEKHNDFIFAVVAEEWGLFGSIFTLLLFVIIFYRIKKIAARAPDNFGYLLATGIFVLYFVQATVNIGMNLGLVPITGISLPFLSYGGSFLVVVLAALGILLNIPSRQEIS